MIFYAKTFPELTTKDLYEIVKSRTEIFLLEQKIICQDLDDKDLLSLHCFFTEGERVIGYLRAFESDDAVVIGRVLTLCHKKGVGRELMAKSLDEIKKHFSKNKILVHAQTQAKGFYEKMGFKPFGEEYLEEGIPHISMEKGVD